MPTHDLVLTVPDGIVVNKDVVISVYSDGEKLGEVRLSRGTIDWKPKKGQRNISMDWERFDEVMRAHRARTLRTSR
jgi:hypothetical protein